ncbi:MAG: hypothetical protein K2L13_00325 [Opitutales bacterium]|nr:hypothetical protein [Opitutales bacterium]
MHQIVFSDQSMVEIRKLNSIELLALIDQLSALANEMFKGAPKDLPKIRRGRTAFYRVKIGTLRVYLALKDKSVLYCHYIIPQHTLTDFIFRSNLPISDEQMIEQHSSFWKYVDSLKKK